MGNPISDLETDIIISREMQLTQGDNGVSTASLIYLDNIGNMQSFPVINLTIHGGSISVITLSNCGTGNVINISGGSVFPSGTVLDIFHDAVYSASANISNCSFSGVFYLCENANNSVRVTLSPTSEITVNLITQWLQPSPVEKVVGYLQGFNISEDRTYKSQGINLLDKHTPKYIIQTVTYNFSIDKMWLDSWFHNELDTETYRIKWATSSDATGIDEMSYYLCGCVFENITWNQGENDIVKEGIKGKGCFKIEG